MAYSPYQFTPAKVPVPPKDEKWVDHVQENRKYLKSIQKVSVHKDFEGIKDTMLFLMEVSTGSVEFNKAVTDIITTNKKGDNLFKLFVKFLDFIFLEIDQTIPNDQTSEIIENSSYSDLFQCMFTPANPEVLYQTNSNIESEKGKLEIKEQDLKGVEHNSEIKDESKGNKKSTDKAPSIKKSGRKKSKSKKEGRLSKDRSISKNTGESKEVIASKEVKLDKVVAMKEDIKSNKEVKENKAEDEPKKGSLTDGMSRGKAALLVMNSMALIRCLQEHTIDVKVARCEEDKDVKESKDALGVVADKRPGETTLPATAGMTAWGTPLPPAATGTTAWGTPMLPAAAGTTPWGTPLPPAADQNKAEDNTLGTVTFRVPESLRTAVLSFVNTNTALPAKETHSDTYKLIDSKQVEVGQINITVTLTCLGKAVENCIREDAVAEEGGYAYEHTKCWRTFSEEKAKVRKMRPKLALELMKTAAAFKPKEWNSDELLRYGVGWGMIKAEEDERRRALGNDCNWQRLVKMAKGGMEPKTEMRLPFLHSKSVFSLKTPIASSATTIRGPIMASRTLIKKDSGWPMTVLSETIVWSNLHVDALSIPQPLDVDAIKKKTENEHLKDQWREQRKINKEFKKMEREKKNRTHGLYERLEKLGAEAPSSELRVIKEPEESPDSSPDDIGSSPTQIQKNTSLNNQKTNASK